MAGYVLIGALAAFGLLCAVWILCGLLSPDVGHGILIYAGEETMAAARQYLWLREMGLVRTGLLVLDPEAENRQWLEDRGIEICSREELTDRLGIGAEET